MDDNGYTDWIQNLIAEAEAYTPAPASRPAATRHARTSTGYVIPRPEDSPVSIYVTGNSAYATYTTTDGLAVFTPIAGTPGGIGW